jgi:hypothetical protein
MIFTPHSPNKTFSWRPRWERGIKAIMDKPEEPLGSLNREKHRLQEQQSVF